MNEEQRPGVFAKRIGGRRVGARFDVRKSTAIVSNIHTMLTFTDLKTVMFARY